MIIVEYEISTSEWVDRRTLPLAWVGGKSNERNAHEYSYPTGIPTRGGSGNILTLSAEKRHQAIGASQREETSNQWA